MVHRRWLNKQKGAMLPPGWFLVLVALLFGRLETSALAHSGESGPRYVADTGRDAGDCHTPDHPCRTIGYALRQAEKGDDVRVAAGVYVVRSVRVNALLSGLTPVRGGYSTADKFALQDPAKNPTYLLGVDFRHRAALFERGFQVLQDEKGWPMTKSSAPATAVIAPTACENGLAGSYPCQDVDFLGRVSLAEFSGQPAEANDVWGFVDLNDQREYAIIGLRNGTAVVDVTDPTDPRQVGLVAGLNAVWRDIKVYQFYDAAAAQWRAYAYVIADQVPQGLQIIDLSALPESVSLAATYNQGGFRSAHNIYLHHVDYTTGVTITGATAFAYLAGSNLDQGAFRIFDLSDPLAPVDVTPPLTDAGYTHDVTSFVLTDSRAAACAEGHNPCEILVDYNETTVDLWDVTDKSAPIRLSSTSYENVAYAHSGWWAEDGRFVFIQDESDERNQGLKTTLRILDLADLRAPVISPVWTGPATAIDHNGFVKGRRYYMSNYQQGLTILDISNPHKPQEVAFFDTYPEGDTADFNGAWGVYPYLPSGTILISDIESGLILVREKEARPLLYLPLIWR